eukprot:gene4092-7380_t
MIKETELENDSLGFHLADRINENLPEDIFIISAQRTTNNFNAKNQCIFRCYEYLLPLKCLNLKNDEEKISKLNFYLKQFLGTNYYHNFTSLESKNFVEKYQNEEQIRQIQVSENFRRDILKSKVTGVVTMNNELFAKIDILGSSFLKNQIRRIIGTIIGIINGFIPDDYITIGLNSSSLLRTPISPGECLIKKDCGFRQKRDLMNYFTTESDGIQQRKFSFLNSTVYPSIANLIEETSVFDELDEFLRKLPFQEDQYSIIKNETLRTMEFNQNLKDLKWNKIKSTGGDNFPPGFRVKLIIEFELLPDEKINFILDALSKEIESGNLEKLNMNYSYYFDYIREFGLERIIRTGEEIASEKK